MSATIDAVVAAWRLASPATRELVSVLVANAWELNRLLAVPAVDPGFDRPEVRAITPESTPDDVRVALDVFDVLALRFDGMPLEVLFSVRNVGGILPTWQAVERMATTRGGAALGGRVADIARSYRALNDNGLSFGAALNDSAPRVWLLSRLQRVQQAPDSGRGWGWVLLVFGVGYLLSEGKGGSR